MDRTIHFGDDEADARYRIQDTSSTGGDLVLAEDLDGGTVLLEYDYSASEWVSRGPVNLNGNNITNAGSISASSLEANKTKRDEVATRIYLNSSTTLNESTAKIVPFDAESYDNAGESDLSNNGVTVSEAGNYEISFSFATSDDIEANSRIRIDLIVNGVDENTRNYLCPSSNFWNPPSFTDQLELDANDTVQIEMTYLDAGGGQSVSLEVGENKTMLIVKEDG